MVDDRKDQILRVASELLQTRSFTSFSYQDLSDRLGITKASIHHHFPTKEDLLAALTERYRARQREKFAEADAKHPTPWGKLEAFLEAMTSIMHSGNKICPLGSLHSELNVLPDSTRNELKALFEFPKRWLASVLEEGRASGDMVFEGAASDRAVLILAAIQGALQIARAQGPKEFTAVVKQIRAGLVAPHESIAPGTASASVSVSVGKSR